MLSTYHLPDFLDYLSHHYQRFYNLYAGRLTELFPSDQPTDNLVIAQDEETTEEQDLYIIQLWKKYIGRYLPDSSTD